MAYYLEAQDLAKGAGRAVKGNTLNKDSLAAINIDLPPLAIQRRIVAVIDSIDKQIAALDAERDALFGGYAALIGSIMEQSDRPVISLGSFLTLDLDTQKVDADAEYRIAGVLGRGLGLIDKGTVKGSETNYSNMNCLHVDQVIMRKLTAWEGPISVVPPEFDGYLASSEFPTFSVDHSQASPKFLTHVCRWPGLWHEMKQRVTGSVQRRKRLNPDQLLSVRLQLPNLFDQLSLADGLDSMHENIQEITTEASRLRSTRSAILNALLSREIEIPESFDERFPEAVAV